MWLALALSEQELGIDITDEQIKELEENVNNIDFDKANEYEKKVRGGREKAGAKRQQKHTAYSRT